MEAKKSTGPNKTQFVLGFPESTPIAEIVAKGKEQGLELKANLVSAVRSNYRRKLAKQAGGEAPKRGPGRPRKATSLATEAPKRGPGRPPKAASAGVQAPKRGPGRPPKAATASVGAADRELVPLVVNYGVREVEAALARIRQRLQHSLV